MNTTQLTEFYSLPSCDEQEQVDCFICQAMNLALEGDAIIAAEMLTKAAEMITERLERENAYKRTTKEMKQHSDDLSVFSCSIGAGGLFL